MTIAEDVNGANPDDEDVFVYTTGSIVPSDVVRVSVHPSVTMIPEKAFVNCSQLEEVELSEGLLEIGNTAFASCEVLKRIKIPSTVTTIGRNAFYECYQLEEVELCEGLQEIGEEAFFHCVSIKRIYIPSTVSIISGNSFADCRKLKEIKLCEGLLLEIRDNAFFECCALENVNIPSTVTKIGRWAFYNSSLNALTLPDGIESIGLSAFYRGTFFTFRIPPLITTIPIGMLNSCDLFSVELSESVTQVRRDVFASCHSLRNVAFPPNAEVREDALFYCTDLGQLFSTYAQIISALKHRFDNLPIHKMLYYQSYESVSVDQLNSATNMRDGQRRSLRSKLDPTGKQQDCLGMTPLHILACSTAQDIGLYQVLIEKYPENLITEDRWGALPLLYAVWGNAPNEIAQYLVGMYKSIYPEYAFNWTEMVETLGFANASKKIIQKLVDLQKDYFPKQDIDWERLLGSVVYMERNKTFGYLVQFSLAKRIDAIGLKQWRDDIKHTTENCDKTDVRQRREFITEVKTKLAHFETEYHNLKEATSIVELALWKHKMNEHILGEKKRRRKKTKIDNLSIREQCRISCGADIVIQHMLPYLVSPPAAPFSEDDSSSSSVSDSESDDELDDDIPLSQLRYLYELDDDIPLSQLRYL